MEYIIQPKISKRQQKREKQRQKERELAQLAGKTCILPVNLNNPQKGLIHIPSKQKRKEESLRQFMNELDQYVNPNDHKTKRLGNNPKSTWDRLQTEHRVAMDKYTCSSEYDYEKKNTRYKFNHGVDMPVKRVSALAGVGKPKKVPKASPNDSLNRFNKTEEIEREQHELK